MDGGICDSFVTGGVPRQDTRKWRPQRFLTKEDILVSTLSVMFLNVLPNRSTILHFWHPLATLRMRAILST